jgi:competence protein ComEC
LPLPCYASSIFLILSDIIVPLLIFILLVGYFIFYPAKESHNPLATDDFLKLTPMQVEVVSLVKHQSCYEAFTVQPLHQAYYFQASWFSCAAFPIHVGDILQVSMILKPLHSSNSPGAFDSLQWARQHNIVAQATIKTAKKVGDAAGINVTMQRLREQLDVMTQRHLHDPDVIAVIEALTLGITQNLSWETLQVFNLSGTRHLLAISGSHIAMVAMFTYAIFFFFMRVMIIFFPRMNAHTAAIALSVLVVGFYVGLSGDQVPTLRAFCMALLGLIAIFLHRYSGLLHRMMIAAMVVIILDHYTLYSPSFYLSFYAVFLIAYDQLWASRATKKIQRYLRLNVLLLIGLVPISLFFFAQYSFIALFANLMAIPWVGLVLLPGAILLQWLSYFDCSVEFLWRRLEWVTQAFLYVLHIFYKITLDVPGIFLTGHMSLCSALFLSLMALLAFLPKGMPGKYCCFLAFIPLFFTHNTLQVGRAQFIFMNVGQGLSVLVKTREHLLVYDAGPKFFTGGDVAQSIILPYLYYQGWKNIDMLMVSHGDADHSGGANTLRKNMPVRQVLSSDLVRVPGATLCQQGQHWQWDGVRFEVLYPDGEHLHRGNNSSCVLKISAGNSSVLLTGDIEAVTERYLVEYFPEQLSATVLSVPHHGSKTSSSEHFLSVVHPSYAVFSYGFLNRFHFPHPDVLYRYSEHDIETFVTESGPVVLEISSLGVTIQP